MTMAYSPRARRAIMEALGGTYDEATDIGTVECDTIKLRFVVAAHQKKWYQTKQRTYHVDVIRCQGGKEIYRERYGLGDELPDIEFEASSKLVLTQP